MLWCRHSHYLNHWRTVNISVHWTSLSAIHPRNLPFTTDTYIDGILPKGPYTPCLRMADRALFAGYPRYDKISQEMLSFATTRVKIGWSLMSTKRQVLLSMNTRIFPDTSITTHLLSIERADWPKLHDMFKARDANVWQREFPVGFVIHQHFSICCCSYRKQMRY